MASLHRSDLGLLAVVFFWWGHLQSVNMFGGELACNLLFRGIYTLTLVNREWIPSKIAYFVGFGLGRDFSH